MKQLVILVAFCILRAQALSDRTPYIINGQNAPITSYNAFVQYLNAAGAGFFGGGSIISDRHIITAAQNIVGFVQWNIGLGSNMYSQLNTLTTNTATAHPNFNAQTRANDIGIITLVGSLIFSQTIYPIALPSRQEQYQLPLENNQGTIVGFGFTSDLSSNPSELLMQSYQRVTTNARCQQFYQITLPNHFCAENTVEFSNVCNGDMGAGFATFVNGNPMLTGVASMITHNCASVSPSGYTRIMAYREWIYSMTQI